jgi:thiamine transport system substrate-binding protein
MCFKFAGDQMNRARWGSLLFLIILLTGCSEVSTGDVAVPELKVMTHDSFAVTESVIEQFEAENGVRVVFIKSGDTGALINRAILVGVTPEADVLYGVDNTYLSRAIEAGIFEPYQSATFSSIPEEFVLEKNHLVTPIDFGDVCINYDRNYILTHELDVPTTLDAFTNPEYKGMLVVENPATSSPGLAFLLTTVARFGQDGYLDYWRELKTNGVVVVNDWSTAYYTNFSGSSGKGMQPFVISYNTSPAAEVFFAENTPSEPPTAAIIAPLTCFRQIEFAGILKGTLKRDLAGKFIEYMLSIPFQEDMPLQMFVFPVNPEAGLPDIFHTVISLPEQPATLSPETIAENRDRWIQDWMGVMLR